ncbi:hypothetical protein EDD21DRAFT_448733 [Dissophora ornata]|nr:hypothetical protein EDD21DRAFT_448733 [Dissophora ornata]
MNSDLRARLLDLGFNLTQARAAVAAGNDTVESAVSWIFESNTAAPSLPAATNQPTLYASAMDETKPLRDTAPPVQTSGPSASTTDTSPDNASAVKKIKINIIHNQPSTTTPLLPLISRHKSEELKAAEASRVAEANKRAEQTKRERMEARLARERTLNALKEDKENRKIRHPAVTNSSAATSSSSNAESILSHISQPTTTPSTINNSRAMVQLRLKNGNVLKKSLESSVTIKDLFEIVRSEDGNVGSADISLIQPFPRREFKIADGDLTLSDAGLCPSCSLNVFVQTPIPAPQPVNPGAWIPQDIDMEDPTAEEVLDEIMSGDVDDDANDHDDDDSAGEENHEIDNDNDEGDEDDEGSEDEEDMVHAMPVVVHPHDPFAGPMRGRGRGRGGGVPFSGAGHSLGSRSSAPTTHPSDEAMEPTTSETNDIRRQRILGAMANRPANHTGGDRKDIANRPKQAKERTIPTLQSLCCYTVAVLLTAKDSKSSRNLKSLGENVGSQISEGIVQELVKLKQLDQLTFRRLYRCPIVNMVLDAYSRATDSLMDAIGISQAHSLTYLSLKECIFLTDSGFSNIGRLEELEYLDLSHCRVTDKTLEFTLNLPNLSTLLLSSTKITSGGLCRIIAQAAWKSTLQRLDLSYCNGITGPFVLVNLQELVNIRTLKLNNTLAFDQSPVKVPDPRSFTRLLDLDLAITPISDNDLVSLLPRLKTVENLNLSSCIQITSSSLEQCVHDLCQLKNFGFPNREHDLLTVLPAAAALPLTHLDLGGFTFVTDDAILALAAASNLQVLSLAGTRLTDVGSAVFAHMSSLRELLLDRTDVGDKSMGYLRDLSRIEVLSLHRCERLTTAGIMVLGKCAFFAVKLKRLNLGYNKYIHDEALAVFTVCKALTALNLEYTDVSEEKALLLQDSLPILKQLRIPGVTNGAVYAENPRPTFT